MTQENHSLFTISQVAKTCSISRSTLMRMEEKGLLSPAYIDPKNNRRYYDPYNVYRVLHIKKFKDMGFSNKEITAYFSSEGNAKPLLTSLEKQIYYLNQYIEEFRMRALDKPYLHVEITTLPEVVCCVHKVIGLSLEEKSRESFNFHHYCVDKGYVQTADPIFIINERTDYLEGKLTTESYPYSICIPLDPQHAPKTAKRFPACKALSVFYSGDFSKINDAWLKLGEEVRKRGLTPADFPRGIAIVAPYTGKEINPHRYCGKIVLPIHD